MKTPILYSFIIEFSLKGLIKYIKLLDIYAQILSTF